MRFTVRANSFLKDFLLFSRIGFLFKPFSGFFFFLSRFGLLTHWVHQHKNTRFADFYRPVRVYADRLKLYGYVMDQDALAHTPIDYLEFGVAGGGSFRWWLEHNLHTDSRFAGFDTFEGLPEDWHFFKKGAMQYNLPEVEDPRACFLKGLFQETLKPFLEKYERGNRKMVVHMDADLYSSTLYALTMLAPYFKPGDVIFFDEFNVPAHEFAAWHDFTRSYYIPYELLGGVNNFYQTAFRLK